MTLPRWLLADLGALSGLLILAALFVPIQAALGKRGMIADRVFALAAP